MHLGLFAGKELYFCSRIPSSSLVVSLWQLPLDVTAGDAGATGRIAGDPVAGSPAVIKPVWGHSLGVGADAFPAPLPPRCKKKVPASKRFTIHRTSNVLTLSLKRFANFSGGKITKVRARLVSGPAAWLPSQEQVPPSLEPARSPWRSGAQECVFSRNTQVSCTVTSKNRGPSGFSPSLCLGVGCA